jgi:four helix bundle protein
MTVYGFRKLVVWQRAMRLSVEVYRLARKLPAVERFALADQMRRAAVSIAANIAEGNGRDHRAEYLRFLSIARGSMMELDTHLELAREFGYLSPADLATATSLLSEVRRLLARLTQSLRPLPLKPEN